MGSVLMIGEPDGRKQIRMLYDVRLRQEEQTSGGPRKDREPPLPRNDDAPAAANYPYRRRYSSTLLARTSRGTLPPRTTVSLKDLRSNRAPKAACARSRCRLISLWPTL
jgi:hypothetical protein